MKNEFSVFSHVRRDWRITVLALAIIAVLLLIAVDRLYNIFSPSQAKSLTYENDFSSLAGIDFSASNAKISIGKGAVLPLEYFSISKGAKCTMLDQDSGKPFTGFYNRLLFPNNFAPEKNDYSFLSDGKTGSEVPPGYKEIGDNPSRDYLMLSKPDTQKTLDVSCDLLGINEFDALRLHNARQNTDHVLFRKVEFFSSAGSSPCRQALTETACAAGSGSSTSSADINNLQSFSFLGSINNDSLERKGRLAETEKALFLLEKNAAARFILFRAVFDSYTSISEVEALKARYLETAVVVSENINSFGKPVFSAMLLASDEKPQKTGITYYLSANGTDWLLAEKGKIVYFPKKGNSLKWKAVLWTASEKTTPVLKGIAVNYTEE